MTSFFQTVLLLLSRYLHIVSATMLVGGTLFYEMVVPIAIDELREEQQLYVFARARWVFKWIVWASVVLILASGVVTTWTHWAEYTNEHYVNIDVPGKMHTVPDHQVPAAGRPGWWWAAHASTGVISVLIALSLTIGAVPPSKPIRWMRLNLVILLLVMFLATATRHARLQAESHYREPSAGTDARGG